MFSYMAFNHMIYDIYLALITLYILNDQILVCSSTCNFITAHNDSTCTQAMLPSLYLKVARKFSIVTR